VIYTVIKMAVDPRMLRNLNLPSLENLQARMNPIEPNVDAQTQQGLLPTGQGIGSGLLGGVQRLARGIGGAVAPVVPQAAKNIADMARFTAMQRASMPSLVTAQDLDKLRPIDPVAIAAQLPTLRAAEKEAMQKPMLDALKAQADLARASGAGRVGTRYKYPSLYVNKDNPDDFIRVLTDTQTQEVVDQATFKPIDATKYVPSSLGIMGKGIASRGDLRTEYKELNTTAGQFKNVQKFFDKLPDLEKGFAGKMQSWTGNIKTFFGAELSPQEAARRLAQGEQQGLLGMFREQVVGGGVMTEQDARRVMERLGNALGDWTTDPSIVARAVQSVMEEKYQAYVGDSQFYGASRSDFKNAPEHKTVSMPTFELPQSFVDAGLNEDDWAETPYEERLTWRGLN
jgi:hypothetical protein